MKTRANARRILLVDDEPLARFALFHLISSESDLEVCGEAASTAEALSKVRQARPDLVILDIVIEGDRGLEFIEQAAGSWDLPVLVCSRREETFYAERCLKAGARGYISKREPITEILAAIRCLLKGEVSLSSRVSQRVLDRIARGSLPIDQEAIHALTDREVEVLQLLGQGYTTRQVADELHLAIKTVQSHCQGIKWKLGLTTSSELIRRAVHWILEGR